LGYLFGGWLTENFSWREAFIIVGLPGLLMAVFVRFGIREPVRVHSQQAVEARKKSHRSVRFSRHCGAGAVFATWPWVERCMHWSATGSDRTYP